MVKPLVMAALVLAVVGVAVSGVIAWLSTTSSVSNTFELGTVNPTVQETFENDTKSDVFIKNNGNVPIYVRAQVNIYWVDDEGNQLWDQPVAGTDYTLTQSIESSSWKQGADGFYYWTQPLAAGASTDPLIDEFKLGYAPDGRTLVCDVSVQGIQAEPSDAVIEAWSTDAQTVSVDAATGKLTIAEKTGE